MKSKIVLLVILVLTACVPVPRVLTLNDVIFDKNTGTILKYVSNHVDIIVPDKLGGISVFIIGKEAFYDHGLTRLEIPHTVTYIEESAFALNELTNVTIPNTVIHIGEYAFAFNFLTNVTIPHSVIYIGNWAFDEKVTLKKPELIDME